MGRRISFTKKQIIKILKKAKTRSDIIENRAAHFYLRKNYPELLEKFFPLKIKEKLTKYQDRKDYITKENLIKKLKEYKNRSDFSKRNPVLLNVSKKYYPEVLNEYFPLKKKWSTISLTEKEMTNLILSYRTRSQFIRKNSAEFTYCIFTYPHLLDKLRPIKNKYFIDNFKNKKQLKQEIIRKMKKAKTRSQFKWNYFNHYKYMKKFFPNLIDQILPKIDSGTTSLGEESTRHFLQKIFKIKIKSSRPLWLINPKTNKSMELDGLNLSKKLAFEYGDHTNIIFKNKEKMKKIQEKDKLKEKICKRMKIKLIQIKTDIFATKNPEESLKSQLIKEFKRLNIRVSSEKIKKEKFKIIFLKKTKYTKEKLLNIGKKYKNPMNFLRNKKYSSACFRLGEYQNIKKELFKIKNQPSL